MALIALNLKPDNKILKDFGSASLIMLAVIGGLLMWLEKIAAGGLLSFCVAGITIFILSRISAKLVKPLYLLLVIATFPIGWVISHVVMAIFYYGVITSVAFAFKLIGRDVLDKKIDNSVDTYWIKYTKKRKTSEYFNQT